MRFALKGMLLGLAGWLLASGSAQAQTIFIAPNVNSPFQRPGVNPFMYVPPNTGGYGYPGYGAYNPPFGLQTQFVDPVQAVQAQQQGLAQPAAPVPSSGLPPFSTLPPPRYFFNYQPFYPLIPGTGPAGSLPIAGPPRFY
jgi:hypothetical protein